jgi:hypothetical protein
VWPVFLEDRPSRPGRSDQCVTWRQGSTRQQGATKELDNEVAGGLKHLHTSQTLMQSASLVKTKCIKLVITKDK